MLEWKLEWKLEVVEWKSSAQTGSLKLTVVTLLSHGTSVISTFERNLFLIVIMCRLVTQCEFLRYLESPGCVYIVTSRAKPESKYLYTHEILNKGWVTNWLRKWREVTNSVHDWGLLSEKNYLIITSASKHFIGAIF